MSKVFLSDKELKDIVSKYSDEKLRRRRNGLRFILRFSKVFPISRENELEALRQFDIVEEEFIKR